MVRSRSRLLGGAAALSTLLVATACGGSDSADSSVPGPTSTIESSPDRTDPLFRESTSDPDGEPVATTGDSDFTEPTSDSVPTDPTTDGDDAQPSGTTEPGATSPSPSTAPGSATTVAGAPTTPASPPTDTAAPSAGASGPNPFTDIEEFIPASAIDDAPFCTAYANVFNTFLGVTYASALADAGPVGGTQEQVPPETLELLAYPRLIDDVGIIAAEGPGAVSAFVEPLSVRVAASPDLLRSAGFGDDEIARLTTADRLSTIDVGGLFADGIDPRLTSATSALIDGYGDFGEFSNAMGAPASPEDEAQLDSFFESECPLLTVATDGL